MRYHCFITDYDGTLADNDRVTPQAMQALKRLKTTGRKLILVTGRQLEDLQAVFPDYQIFDRIVAENGAVLYRSWEQETKLLAERPPEAFMQLLKQQNIPYSMGHVIVASWEPYHIGILDAIRLTGLEYQVIFNKGAVMVLPPAVNKATGLHYALRELQISEHNTVAIGDAENDNAMLQVTECAVAVQNALPQVAKMTDWTTDKPSGEGVVQLITQLIEDDLTGLNTCLSRHFLTLGVEMDGSPFQICPYGNNILVAGTSGSGKSTLAAAFIEKLVAKAYQFCLIDPEGDYQELSGAVTISNSNQPPSISEVIDLLTNVEENIVVCILAVPLADRPAYFKKLLHAVADLRHAIGHPHFLIMDEVHHLMPRENTASPMEFPEDLNSFMAITIRPELLDSELLKKFNTVLVMGEQPGHTMKALAGLISEQITIPPNLAFQRGDVLAWEKSNLKLRFFRSDTPNPLLMRHKRKYATGDMGSNSFYFNGPVHRMNLKANNLMMFIQMGTGINDETWLYHLGRHDYSNWFKNSVKDEELAQRTKQIEDKGLNAFASRKAIFKAILERYTLPA
jgi:hydroxymethylpyrimidine pyrophosphatase-like HAD family hydrolase/archaellum biogenesis ATPase FlaH